MKTLFWIVFGIVVLIVMIFWFSTETPVRNQLTTTEETTDPIPDTSLIRIENKNTMDLQDQSLVDENFQNNPVVRKKNSTSGETVSALSYGKPSTTSKPVAQDMPISEYVTKKERELQQTISNYNEILRGGRK